MEAPALAPPAPAPYFPVYVSSDEDDDVEVLGASNSTAGIQIQQVTLLSVDSPRSLPTIPTSAASSSGLTAMATTSEESSSVRKGKRRLLSEVSKLPVASPGSLLNPEIHQVIDVDDVSSHRVIDVDNYSSRRVIDVDNYSSRRVIDVDNYSSRRISDVDDDGLIYVGEIDCKGKKPCKGVVREIGECSRGGSTTSSGFYCAICMEEMRARKRFPIPGCAHAFCVSCVRQYIAAKVEENVLTIGCPVPGCEDGGALHPEVCRDVIPPQLFHRWGAALCEMSLGALKFYCPYKDCSALLVHDPGDGHAAITDAECPHCRRIFCAQCKVPWHDGVACAEFQRLGNDERGREDLLLRKVAQENKWQRCPKCKMYVERVAGCVFITCRCMNCFCYLCGATMDRSSHHCKSCNRTY